MQDTLYWKISASGRPSVVSEGELSSEELITWRRIKGEPAGLLNDEE